MKLTTYLSAIRSRDELEDTVAPSVLMTSTAVSPTLVNPIPLTITFSENVTGFVVGDLTIVGATASGFATVNGSIYTVNIIPDAPGAITVDIDAAKCVDVAGNTNTAAPQFAITYIGA